MLLRKPLSGAILGILIGLAITVVLARQAIWPADQMMVFLLPAVTGLLGLLALTVGRQGSNVTLVIALVILLAMAVWGALGIADVNESGELNGGCTVTATSNIDSTDVVDTSRSDPFELEANGPLTWTATSPEPFTNYEWQINVDIGGFAVPIDSATEPNEPGNLENGGDVPNVQEYASARGINIDLYSGVYEVSGSAATCDGFGFVKIITDGVDPVTLIALGLILLLLIILLILVYPGRRSKVASTTVETTEVAPTDAEPTPTGTGTAESPPTDEAGGRGRHISDDQTPGETGSGDIEGPDEGI